MQHYYEHGRNPIGLGHPARLLRWRYGPAGDSAPRLRLKAYGMAERFPFGFAANMNDNILYHALAD